MALKNLSFLTLGVSMILSILSSSSSIGAATPPIVPPETVCRSAANPSFCKTLLANQNGTVFDYGRFTVTKSLSQSRKFLNLVDSHLQDASSFSQPTIRALEDCSFLAELNFEFLSNALNTASYKASDVLPSSQAEEMHTLLSAVLTNQHTCLEGLETTTSDQRLKDDLLSSLSNDTKLHAVSLALFVKGWVPHKKTQTSWQPNIGRHLGFRNGRLPLKMSNRARAIYDSAVSRGRGRKLLQASGDNLSVTVSDIVVVSQDGSGNFTAINDAIAAAPNNTNGSGGYFLIFVTEGVYQEYVSIPKNKKYLMMAGDGINRTIITGDHNVVDNFTTFNSATFGKQN